MIYMQTHIKAILTCEKQDTVELTGNDSSMRKGRIVKEEELYVYIQACEK